MFAPPVAKPQSAAPQRAAFAPQRSKQTPAARAGDARAAITLAAGGLWNFGKIAIFGPAGVERRWMLSPFPALQAKLAVGASDDPLEREADRVADRVMAMPTAVADVGGAPPAINRKCAVCDDEETLQAKPSGVTEAVAVAAPESISEVLRSPGRPLDTATRAYFEPRFGHDFSGIRVHADAAAAASAREIGAHAYTVGRHVVFAAGRFAPASNDGRRLIAHELTHTVQQAGPAAVRVSRFTEPEHKKLGNLAKSGFPYFATLATDEVALRSSPEGRWPENQFHNLVASLRTGVRVLVVGNVRKWLRVMVHSGTALDGKTNKPVDAAGLTGYVSEELLVKEPGVFDQQLPVLPGLSLTYGDFTALGGDHFAKFVDLEQTAQAPGGKERIKKFVDVVDGKKSGDFEDPNTIDSEWAERYKNLAFENIAHFSHGGTAVETWKKDHYLALMAAAKAGYFSDIGALQRAYAMNAFADHFLTDSFSSGHVRTPRKKILEFFQNFFDQHMDSILNDLYTEIGDQIILQLFHDYPNTTSIGMATGEDFCADNREAITQIKQQVEKQLQDNHLQRADLQKLLVEYIGGAVSKVLHDDDNTQGLEVKSKKHPEGWKAFGDGKLNASFQNYAVEAVEASKAELMQAFNIGIDYKKNKGDVKLYELIKPLVEPRSKIEDYIPDVNTAKTAPLPEWRIDTTGWDTMDKPMQDKFTALIKRYLDDKTLRTLLAKIPNEVEKEITGPNVYLRPRDAIEHVLRQFRDNPVEFILGAAAAPKQFDDAVNNSVICRMFRHP